MNPQKAKSILNNDDELDIAKLAEAHAEQQKHMKPKKRSGSMQRSLTAWMKLKDKEKIEEGWRQRVARAWDKTKK